MYCSLPHDRGEVQAWNVDTLVVTVCKPFQKVHANDEQRLLNIQKVTVGRTCGGDQAPLQGRI